ncbi:MAG: ABC transporter substrate-binding protein [Xanthobacteraceae bacterium]
MSAEGVLGLNPDLIIAAEGAGPKETSPLNEAKVPIVTVPETFTEDGILERIRIVARELGAEKRGQCLVDGVTDDLAKLRKLRETIAGKRRVMFVMSMVAAAPWSGRKTAADAINSLAGAVSAVEGYDGYKSLTEEAIVTARPDAILVMERGRDSISSDAIFSNAAFAMTPAAESKTFVAMDGLYLLGFGPRTANAARDLARALYPRLPEANEPAASQANCRQ